MRQLKNIKWLPVSMAITILGIAIFQLYWLKNTYEREKRTLEMRSNFTFRDVVFSIQASKIDFNKWTGDSLASKTLLGFDNNPSKRSTEMIPVAAK